MKLGIFPACSLAGLAGAGTAGFGVTAGTVVGESLADLVAAFGVGGAVSLFNNQGDTHLVGDVVGYFSSSLP